MTDDEIIAVVQAHKEGKEIEFCSNPHGIWFDLTYSHEWAKFDCRKYRVKPRKPREWWILESDLNGRNMSNHVGIHVREVME